MCLPGFTAESSVYSSSWRAASVGLGNTQRGLISPQVTIGDPHCDDQCCAIDVYECDDVCLSLGHGWDCCRYVETILACGDPNPF